MSVKKKVPGKPFKKGQSGNPGGRPKLPADVRAIQNLTREEFIRMMNALYNLTTQELNVLSEKPDTPALMAWAAQCILRGKENGDYGVLDRLMNRIIGPVPDEVAMTFPRPTVIEKRDGGRVILGHEGGDDGDQ